MVNLRQLLFPSASEVRFVFPQKAFVDEGKCRCRFLFVLVLGIIRWISPLDNNRCHFPLFKILASLSVVTLWLFEMLRVSASYSCPNGPIIIPWHTLPKANGFSVPIDAITTVLRCHIISATISNQQSLQVLSRQTRMPALAPV